MINQNLIITNPTALIKNQMSDPTLSGMYAKVYNTHDPEIILKTNKESSDAWLIWALFSMQYQHKWMPRIHKLRVTIDSHYEIKYWALMERLTHPKNAIENPTNIMGYYYDYEEGRIHEEYCGSSYRLHKQTIQELEGYYSMALSMFERIEFDLHGYNWMFRGKQEVVTDPWSDFDIEMNKLKSLINDAKKENPDNIYVNFL